MSHVSCCWRLQTQFSVSLTGSFPFCFFYTSSFTSTHSVLFNYINIIKRDLRDLKQQRVAARAAFDQKFLQELSLIRETFT